MEEASVIIGRLKRLADANGRPAVAIQVTNPTVTAFDADGAVTASVAVERGINDRMRSEIRQEALVRGLGVR